LLAWLLMVMIAQSPSGDAKSSAEAMAEFALNHPGEPSAGQLIFADRDRAGCARCHRVGDEGAETGPNLANIGGKLGREHLIESLLFPSRQVVEGYRPSVIALKDGRVLTGLIRGQEEGQVVFNDAEGERRLVSLSEVEDFHPTDVSLMPEGLAERLQPREFCDLIAYLQSLKAAGQGTPGSGVAGPIALPPGFSRMTIAEGFTGATALAVAPDDRLFVCEQTGTLRVIRDGRLLPEPFVVLDVDSNWERGLIGVAVDPEFETNQRIYVCYVASKPYPHHRISRFVAQGDVAVAGSEEILFEGEDQSKLGGVVPAGHQGGAIHFGLDGKLYLALGEQTAERPAQDLGSLLGKILRLNADGSIPRDNPFVDRTTGKYQAIWALGCRNPFTFAVQPETGRIFLNDVGGKAEEINEAATGANFGWPNIEHGPTHDSNFQGPVHWYPTASICGGAFCRRTSPWPDQYRGKYFFMDFVLGWIQTIDPSDTRRPARATTFATGLTRPVDLAFGSHGELYVLIRDAWVRDAVFEGATGSLQVIRYEGSDGHAP
jgi:putative heme-binding domain-containing protein